MTIATLAALAGVSKGTVSKALNDSPGVSRDTRERIRGLAARHDFHPNATAAALARQKAGIIALAMPLEAGPVYEGAYWAAFIAAMAAAAARRSVLVAILTPDAGREGADGFAAVLRRRSVDGMVVAAELLRAETAAALERERMPFVRLGGAGGADASPDAYLVDVDNFAGARDMTERLLAAGRRRIAFLAGPERLGYMERRLAGYAAALAAAGIKPAGAAGSEYRAADAKLAAARLLAAPAAPDALFIGAGGPTMLGAVEAWREAGGAAAGVALAVFDDTPALELVDPPISAVRQPIGAMAEAAVEALLDLVDGRRPEAAARVLAPELVLRGDLA
jgi:LacI family transcriptional regulator